MSTTEKLTKITRLLVANRGEIALRVMRSARSMGIASVAVYSDADAGALHVRYADDAVHIGASPVGESYLQGEKILAAAIAAGADAIHPGYGFLSENADFAEAVTAAGLIFVGPPTRAIEVMGDKAVSKRAMIEAGVPCIPGYQGEDQSDKRLIAESDAVGFPLMVKAAAGGGGRGMRLVFNAEELPNAIRQARSEAENAFGSGDLIIERAVLRPRHVEIQVFADSHGNVLHFGERDCSVQRRHQKVIEEAPCPIMTPALRERMGSAAVEAARAVDYRGAGTVEFLLDESGDFFFLEMNTRLQVEHPVTELVTGLDLVALQLQVAQGEALGLVQSDVELNGHAIEVRLYAEDPDNDFLPSTGPVHLWQVPADTGIRVDTGIESGGEVSPFYDPMVAKIIAHGPTREAARQRLLRALQRSALLGTKTNRGFLIDALAQPGFADGSATTAFIGETYPEGYHSPQVTREDYAIAAVLQYQFGLQRANREALGVSPELLEWSSAEDLESVYRYQTGEEALTLLVLPQGGQKYDLELSPEAGVADSPPATDIELLSLTGNSARLLVNGRRLSVLAFPETEQSLHLAIEAGAQFTVVNIAAGAGSAADAASSGSVAAPMHGLLLAVEVEAGDTVEQGQRVAILEAMKMQHEIIAPISGKVVQVCAVADQQIAADDLIAEIEPEA